MFGKRFRILTAFGFPISIDLSWFVIAFLITWSLAVGVFPVQFEGLSVTTYWVMGVTGALGLFVSIVLHELGHALVARRFHMRIRGITLFIFGGVAELEDEPPSAKAEFLVAIAGPIVSVLISAACFGASALATAAAWPTAILGVVMYLATINAILVAFNLLPAFPLDGGRMFRALLWYWKDDLRSATRITSGVGAAFGILFIGLGVLRFIFGDFLGGMWWFLIGLFLRNAAQQSYQQLLIRRALQGMPVERFMTRQPVTVPRDISLQQLVDEYVYRHYHKMYPVTSNGDLYGCVSLGQIKGVDRDLWPRTSVGDVAEHCSRENVVSPTTDAMAALAKMNRTGASRMMVVDEGRLVGVLCLKDLMKFLSARIDLGEDRE